MHRNWEPQVASRKKTPALLLAVRKNSTLFLHIPVLLGPAPAGALCPFMEQTGNSLWDLLRGGDVTWLLQLRRPHPSFAHLGGHVGGVR